MAADEKKKKIMLDAKSALFIVRDSPRFVYTD